MYGMALVFKIFLYNSKFSLSSSSKKKKKKKNTLGDNAIVVKRVHCTGFYSGTSSYGFVFVLLLLLLLYYVHGKHLRSCQDSQLT